MNIKTIMPGDFLAASQFLFDAEFAKSVVLITGTDGRGYSGIKINHVLQGRNTPSGAIAYSGGPVAKRTGNIIHTPDVTWEKTRHITAELCITNIDKNTVDLEREQMPQSYFLAFGFATWIKGQLEEEIMNGFWLPVNTGNEIIFSIPAVDRWYAAHRSASIYPECVSGDSGRC